MLSNEMGLRDVYRAGDVYRWQIVKTSRQQSIAEHSFFVAMIAMEIFEAVFSGSSEFNQENRELVREWALLHDMPEVLTGDISTPLKDLISKETNGNNPFALVEKMTYRRYKLSLDRINEKPHLKAIVKLADYLEAMQFLEENACHAHGHMIRFSIGKKFGQYVLSLKSKWKEYDWGRVQLVKEELMLKMPIIMDEILEGEKRKCG